MSFVLAKHNHKGLYTWTKMLPKDYQYNQPKSESKLNSVLKIYSDFYLYSVTKGISIDSHAQNTPTHCGAILLKS
jgi:hypothetical protein